MKVLRKNEVVVDKINGFKVGDQIKIGRFYTATCQKVGKKGAIFMMDQYLDHAYAMNANGKNEGGYEESDLRHIFKNMELNPMFDEVRSMLVPFKNGDYFRIPTAEEMFGPEEAHKYYETLSNKKQWPLMKDRENRIAFRGEDQEGEWGWLQNKYKNSTAYFASVYYIGGVGHADASSAYGVRVVFRLSFKNKMRHLKAGYYYIDIANKIMQYCDDGSDYSDIVMDFNIFSKIGCDRVRDMIQLVTNDITGKASFIHYPISSINDPKELHIDFYDVFRHDEAKPIMFKAGLPD